MFTRLAIAAMVLTAGTGVIAPALDAMPEDDPRPGSPEYVTRDVDNMRRANGREAGPDGRADDPDYPAARARAAAGGADDEDPYRVGTWDGVRGKLREVTFADTTSSSGATFSGRVHAPLDGARHPDTGERLSPPYPGVVIVHGTNLSAGRFAWAAQDLAERGYVTLTFTIPPPQGAPRYFSAAKDAIDFFWSTPSQPVRQPGDAYNPFWSLFDRSPQPAPSTPDRPYRFAIAGHSIGAAVVSALGNIDQRVSAIVGWDRLIKSDAYFVGGETAFDPGEWVPSVPALGVHSEYFFEPTPYPVACALPFGCEAHPPAEAPPPDRELSISYGGDDGWGIVAPQPGGWAAADVDIMLLVLRSSTHSEYVDGPDTRASRYGKAVTSYYQSAWLDRYLKQDPTADQRLQATTFRWLEPRAHGVWRPTPELHRDENLSIYFCSAWRHRTLKGDLVDVMDPTGAGCAPSSDGAGPPGASTPMPEPDRSTEGLTTHDRLRRRGTEAGCAERGLISKDVPRVGEAGESDPASGAAAMVVRSNGLRDGDVVGGADGASLAWLWALLPVAGALMGAGAMGRGRLR